MNIVYFDLETQKLAQEVGGWSNIDKLKLAAGVTYSTEREDYAVYLEKDVDALIAELTSADVVIGFNIKSFDYIVLSPYVKKGTSLWKIRSVDMMEHIHRALGFRVALDSLAEITLGERKSADGLQSVRWFKAGQLPDNRTFPYRAIWLCYIRLIQIRSTPRRRSVSNFSGRNRSR